MIKHVSSKEEFNELTKNGLVLVDFYADWCGPCQMLSPVIEELDEEMEITVLKIDVDELSDIAREYRVMAIPTLLLFRDGQLVKRETAYMPIEHLRKFVK